MNYQQILALLTQRFSGVRKDVLVNMARNIALQVTTEEEAKAIVDKFTDAQVNEFAKEYRAVVDKEVSESNKAFENNLRKKFDFTEKQQGEPGAPQQKGGQPDIAEIVKQAVADAVAPMQAQLDGYKAADLSKTRLQILNDKLSACKDETFKSQTLKDFARMKFDTDEDFNEYLNDKAKDIAAANQTMADKDLSNAGGASMFSQKNDKGISKGVAEYLDAQKSESTPFSGKEI